MKIVLISCASKKEETRKKAKEMYISPLFKLSLKYAHSLNPDKIFILSAKYGLLNPEEKIESYNLTLNNINKKEAEQWALKVLDSLKRVSDLEKDEFIFLAGKKYNQFLVKSINNYRIPMEGLGIGKQLQWLKQH